MKAWIVVYALLLVVIVGSFCAINRPRSPLVLAEGPSSSLPLYDGPSARTNGRIT